MSLFEYILGKTLHEVHEGQWEKDAEGKDIPHEDGSKFLLIGERQIKWVRKLML